MIEKEKESEQGEGEEVGWCLIARDIKTLFHFSPLRANKQSLVTI